MNSSEKPLVAVVVLNWNGCNETLACLESLIKLSYPPCDLIVVDNGSTDNSVAAVRSKYPNVEVIQTGKNLGYAGGNNVGIRRALEKGAQYILILNNDTRVSPDAISRA